MPDDDLERREQVRRNQSLIELLSRWIDETPDTPDPDFERDRAELAANPVRFRIPGEGAWKPRRARTPEEP